MLISMKQKLAFLAMPKTASTSIERALAPHCDIHYRKLPRVKHMPYRRFNRFLTPYLNEIGFPDIETTCLFREPVSWVFSWYRYRSRPAILGKPESCAHLSFEEFVIGYTGEYEDFPRFGRQAHFVAGKDDKPAVDHIFRFENLPEYVMFLEERFQTKLEIKHLNASPVMPFDLSKSATGRLERYLASEYEIFETARAR